MQATVSLTGPEFEPVPFAACRVYTYTENNWAQKAKYVKDDDRVLRTMASDYPGSTLKRRAFWLVLLVVVFMAGFQWRNAEMVRFADGQNVAPLDGRIGGYTPREAADLFDALGEDGLTFYAVSEVSLDLVFPLFYGALFAALVWLFWESPWRTILATTIALAVLTDLTENLLIAIMAFTYVDGPQALARAANAATILKWGLLAVVSAGVVVGGLRTSVFRHSRR